MKFTPDTLAALKNFSLISQSILIEPGSQLATRSHNNTILAHAFVPEVFDDELAIYDLPQFLNVFTMFQDPTLDLSGGRQAAIREGKTVVRYTFAEPSLLTKTPLKIQDPQTVTSFELTGARLQQLMKAATVMGLPEVVIKGDGHTLSIGATDSQSSSSNTYDVDIGETDQIFTALIKLEYFKQLVRDYRVTVTQRYTKFESIDDSTVKVVYYLAIEQHSKF